jgi:hypothetical protein
MIERESKVRTSADIERLEKERDIYKTHWEILGIFHTVINHQAKEIETLNARLEEKSPGALQKIIDRQSQELAALKARLAETSP